MEQQPGRMRVFGTLPHHRAAMLSICLLLIATLSTAIVLGLSFPRLLIVAVVLACPVTLLVWATVERQHEDVTQTRIDSMNKGGDS